MAGGAPGGGAPMLAEVRDLQARIEKDPKDADAIRRLADLNFDISNWQKARDYYSRYLEIRPGDPDVMTDLGVTYRGLKEYDRALELFDQVSKAAPEHWQSRYNQVVVLAFDLNRMDAAQQALAELRRLQPNNDKVSELAAAVEKRKSA
jgi:tetratricopeptide (TPR) repeat protein